MSKAEQLAMPVVMQPEESPRGFGSRGVRRNLVTDINTAVRDQLVLPAHDAQIKHGPHGKLYFVVPPPGENVTESAMRLSASGMLGNEGAIAARLNRHRETKIASDTRNAFGRFEVGILNDDGHMPWNEHIMSLIQASKALKSIESFGEIGGVINFLDSFGLPLLKATTRDSARAKWRSLVVSPIMGIFGAALALGVLPTAHYLSAVRLENGFDMGDQIADIAQMVGYGMLLDHLKVEDNTKQKFARAFLTEYTKGEGPNGPRQRPQVTQQGVAAGAVDQAVLIGKRVDRVVDVPFLGETIKAVQAASGLAKGVKHEKRSMRERVNDILAVADQRIAEAELAIKAHPKRVVGFNIEYHEAQVKLAVWQYRKVVATVLKDIAAKSERVLKKEQVSKAGRRN